MKRRLWDLDEQHHCVGGRRKTFSVTLPRRRKRKHHQLWLTLWDLGHADAIRARHQAAAAAWSGELATVRRDRQPEWPWVAA